VIINGGYIIPILIFYGLLGFLFTTGRIVPLTVGHHGPETWIDRGIIYFGAGILLGLIHTVLL
jgi:hypothetical protein